MNNEVQNAIIALKLVVAKMQQEGINETNVDDFLTCLRGLLQHPLFSKKFLLLLSDYTYNPEVIEQAKQHKLGLTGLKMFRWAVKKLVEE